MFSVVSLSRSPPPHDDDPLNVSRLTNASLVRGAAPAGVLRHDPDTGRFVASLRPDSAIQYHAPVDAVTLHREAMLEPLSPAHTPALVRSASSHMGSSASRAGRRQARSLRGHPVVEDPPSATPAPTAQPAPTQEPSVEHSPTLEPTAVFGSAPAPLVSLEASEWDPVPHDTAAIFTALEPTMEKRIFEGDDVTVICHAPDATGSVLQCLLGHIDPLHRTVWDRWNDTRKRAKRGTRAPSGGRGQSRQYGGSSMVGLPRKDKSPPPEHHDPSAHIPAPQSCASCDGLLPVIAQWLVDGSIVRTVPDHFTASVTINIVHIDDETRRVTDLLHGIPSLATNRFTGNTRGEKLNEKGLVSQASAPGRGLRRASFAGNQMPSAAAGADDDDRAVQPLWDGTAAMLGLGPEAAFLEESTLEGTNSRQLRTTAANGVTVLKLRHTRDIFAVHAFLLRRLMGRSSDDDPRQHPAAVQGGHVLATLTLTQSCSVAKSKTSQLRLCAVHEPKDPIDRSPVMLEVLRALSTGAGPTVAMGRGKPWREHPLSRLLLSAPVGKQLKDGSLAASTNQAASMLVLCAEHATGFKTMERLAAAKGTTVCPDLAPSSADDVRTMATYLAQRRAFLQKQHDRLRADLDKLGDTAKEKRQLVRRLSFHGEAALSQDDSGGLDTSGASAQPSPQRITAPTIVEDGRGDHSSATSTHSPRGGGHGSGEGQQDSSGTLKRRQEVHARNIEERQDALDQAQLRFDTVQGRWRAASDRTMSLRTELRVAKEEHAELQQQADRRAASDSIAEADEIAKLEARVAKAQAERDACEREAQSKTVRAASPANAPSPDRRLPYFSPKAIRPRKMAPEQQAKYDRPFLERVAALQQRITEANAEVGRSKESVAKSASESHNLKQLRHILQLHLEVGALYFHVLRTYRNRYNARPGLRMLLDPAVERDAARPRPPQHSTMGVDVPPALDAQFPATVLSPTLHGPVELRALREAAGRHFDDVWFGAGDAMRTARRPMQPLDPTLENTGCVPVTFARPQQPQKKPTAQADDVSWSTNFTKGRSNLALAIRNRTPL